MQDDQPATKEDISDLKNAFRRLSRDTKTELAEHRLSTHEDIKDLRYDMADMKAELKQDITDVRTELKQDISDVRTELKQDIADVRTELKQDIANLAASTHQDMQTLKQEIVDEISEVLADAMTVIGMNFQRLEHDVNDLKADVADIKQILSPLAAQVKDHEIRVTKLEMRPA